MDKDVLARDVANVTKIPWNGRNVERVLSSLLITGDFWNVVSLSCEPLPAVAALLKLMAEEGMVAFSEYGIKLTQRG